MYKELEFTEIDLTRDVQKNYKFHNRCIPQYTLAQHRLLEIYLSVINIEDSMTSTVTFTVKNYNDLVGVKTTTRDFLESTVCSMSEIKVPVELDKNNIIEIPLFEKAIVDFDNVNYRPYISLTSNPKLDSLFFNGIKKGYVSYPLREVLSLKKKYSLLLYSYIKANRFRGTWKVRLDKLHKILGISSKSYKNYNIFNGKILIPAIEEIYQKTGLKINYETDNIWRRTHELTFHIDK